jgi:hypothetical protein
VHGRPQGAPVRGLAVAIAQIARTFGVGASSVSRALAKQDATRYVVTGALLSASLMGER